MHIMMMKVKVVVLAVKNIITRSFVKYLQNTTPPSNDWPEMSTADGV